MDAEEIKAITEMPEGEWRVWLATKFEAIEVRFVGMERKRWPWAVAGGGASAIVAGIAGAFKLFM